MNRWRQVLAGVVTVLAVTGCGASGLVDPDPTGPTRTVEGTVIWLDFEGGFYAIRGTDRVTYDPRELPTAFQQHQLPVRATLRIRSDMASFHMVGPVVDVLAITQR